LAKESGGNLATLAGKDFAKESGGNLAAAKADLDTIAGQVDAKTSTLAKETGGNLATIAGQLDAKTSTLAKESGGNLAAAKGDLDTIASQTANIATEDGNLAGIKSDADSIVTNTAVPNIRPLTTSDQVTIGDILLALKYYIDWLCKPIWYKPSTNALLVDLGNSGTLSTVSTVSTVTTVSTLTTLSQLGGVGIFDVFLRGQWMNQWADQVRRQMTTS
jgi:hypothetical protein